MYKTQHYIHGNRAKFQESNKKSIVNPASGEIIGQLALADHAIIDEAITSAAAAFPAWAATPAPQRAKILFRFREIMVAQSEALATIVHEEHGKSLAEARASVGRGIECIEFVCGIPKILQGQYSENVAHNVDCYSLRQPLGVCCGISPFNFPVMVPVWCFAQAIACGNTFILKPSPHDPTCSLRMAEMLTEAGLPPGVLNIVHGDKDVVDALLADTRIKAVTAVASTPVAKSIYETALLNGKRAQTFGGAKNHGIVMPDANLDHAAEQLFQAAYGSAGERCMALSVAMVVGDTTANSLLEKLKCHAEQCIIGSGENDIGPLISAEHKQRVLNYIDIGIHEGAELIFDGRKTPARDNASGYFCGPCCFDHVKPTMRVYRDEIFGPVLSIVRVPDFETALELTNSHQYGNGTALFTQSGHLAREFASRVQAGMIGINVPIPVPVSFHRFGGWKDSFFGDIEMHAEQSALFYTHGKSVTVTWPKKENEQ